jgi:hypothetical protein
LTSQKRGLIQKEDGCKLSELSETAYPTNIAPQHFAKDTQDESIFERRISEELLQLR